MEEQRQHGFKTKTIKQLVQSKKESWAKSVDDDDVEKHILEDTFLTGGAITSMLLGEEPNDYDFYFKTKEAAVKVANYYLDKYLEHCSGGENGRIDLIEARETDTGVAVMIKSSGTVGEDLDTTQYQYFESLPQDIVSEYFKEPRRYSNDGKFKPIMITENAISLTDNVQMVLRFVGEPDDIHNNYDFAHCKNYYDRGELHLDPKALECTLTKELKYVGSKYPVCSLFRLRKFIRRGWRITAGEVFKIAYDVSKLDLDDPVVLQDQLMGVDYAYFNEVVSILKDKDSRDISRTYLFELVDYVFDDVRIVDEYE